MREGKMTCSSAIKATDIKATDLRDDKLTSSRASPGVVVVKIGVFGFRLRMKSRSAALIECIRIQIDSINLGQKRGNNSGKRSRIAMKQPGIKPQEQDAYQLSPSRFKVIG
eukprot:scaffold1362_cov61-Attheya_sp.AAC.5